MQKKYIIFDLDGTLIRSNSQVDQIVFDYIAEHIDPEQVEYARYLFDNFGGISNKEVLEKIGTPLESLDYHDDQVEKQVNAITDEIGFFSDTIAVITKLSENHTLLLSTGASDSFAQLMLEKGGIKQYFSYILGSSHIPKSTRHIDKFIEYTQDDTFAENAIFIGDGGRDKEIADTSNIDFIGIGDHVKTDHKIKSLNELLDILEIRE